MANRPPAIGLRHLALQVSDVTKAARFYVDVLGFTVEWAPDANSMYLCKNGDNLALHRFVAKSDQAIDQQAFDERRGQRLGHLGILVRHAEDVDAWGNYLIACGIPLLAGPRTHRDGARSLYCADADGNVVQILHHPPISEVQS